MKWPTTGVNPNGKERDALLRGALDHRDDLLREWERKVVAVEDI